MSSTFTLLVLCVQVCLVQNAYSQCIGSSIRPAMAPGFPVPRYTPAIVPAYAPAYNPGFAAPAAFAPSPKAAGAYGGEGIGDIAIAGRMPVAGTTAIAGQVPILGSVRFGGDVAARGTVTITGSSGYSRGRYC